MNISDNTHDEIEIDLSQLFYILWKNVLWIILAAVICADIGYGIATFAKTPIYTASADMLVNNKQNASSSENANTVTSSDLTASSSLVTTYSIILKSHTVLEKVIRTLGLDYSYAELSNMISVSTVDNTQVMRVTVKNEDPQIAMDIVAQIVSLAPAVIVDKAEVGSVKTVDQPWSSGCCFFVLRELLNNTFKTEADVTRELGLPILGVIPLEEGGSIGQKSVTRQKN